MGVLKKTMNKNKLEDANLEVNMWIVLSCIHSIASVSSQKYVFASGTNEKVAEEYTAKNEAFFFDDPMFF